MEDSHSLSTHSTKHTPRTKDAQVAPISDAQVMLAQDNASKPPASAAVAPEATAGPPIILEQVKTAGKLAFKENLKMYGKMMIPLVVVSLWMFGLFGLISWFVPHVLCSDLIQELSGSSLGISSCVYNSDGEYTPYDGSKVFWLLFWALQSAWVALFPGFICKAIFGSSMSRFQSFFTITVGICVFVAPFITGIVFNMALNNYIVLVSSSVGSLAVNIACASAAVRYTGNNLMKWRWILLFAFAGQVNTFYLFIMPRLITLRSQDALGGMGLTVVRIFVHPIVWSIVLFYFRIVQRHIGRVKDLTQTCFLVWPVLYSSLYGRFLLLQLEGVGSIVVMNFMFACFSISGALMDRGNDLGWLSLLYGRRASEAMQATLDVDEMELVDQLTGSMMEAASIVAASALLSFGGVATSPGVPPDHSMIWYNAVVQLATTLLFNFAEVVACGKFHNLEWRKVYPRSTFRFLGYVLLVLTIGGARLCLELLLLFCPKYYDEYGILLEQCDRPSLFQAISFTFARRAHGTALGRWLDTSNTTTVNGFNSDGVTSLMAAINS